MWLQQHLFTTQLILYLIDVPKNWHKIRTFCWCFDKPWSQFYFHVDFQQSYKKLTFFSWLKLLTSVHGMKLNFALWKTNNFHFVKIVLEFLPTLFTGISTWLLSLVNTAKTRQFLQTWFHLLVAQSRLLFHQDEKVLVELMEGLMRQLADVDYSSFLTQRQSRYSEEYLLQTIFECRNGPHHLVLMSTAIYLKTSCNEFH